MEYKGFDIGKMLLVCGILAGMLYIGMDIIAATFLYPGYSYTDQQVSELSAIGAPTKAFWSVMGMVYIILILLFAIAVLQNSKKKISLRNHRDTSFRTRSCRAVMGFCAYASTRDCKRRN